jgi:flagellar basal-body rod modification protein FlgD
MSTSASAIQAASSSNSDYLAGTTNTAATSKALGQQDFLKLLVAQLSAQDPLNPQKDTDYLAQLAQFSSLEQTKSMQTDLAQLRSDQQMTQAQALLGRTVQIQTGADTTITGRVQAVQIDAGTPKLSVNGLLYDLSQVTAIASPAQTSNFKLL